MNERIRTLLGQALDETMPYTWTTIHSDELVRVSEKFVELVKMAIYEEVKSELLEKSEIECEPNEPDKWYLRGCNAGTWNALYSIRMFGVNENEGN